MKYSKLILSAAVAIFGFASVVYAADLPVKALPYNAAAPVSSWTGFYVGGNVGYSWGKGDAGFNQPSSPSGLPVSISGSQNLDGIIGGGQIGYNWQVDKSWVFGLEADFQGSGEKGSNSFSVPYASGFGPQSLNGAFSSNILSFGTVRGRAALLVSPSMLLYVTGGLAYGKISTSGFVTNTLVQFANSCACGFFSFDGSANKVGWTLGAGVEGAIPNTGNWTWKVEYLYIDFGTVSGNGVQSGFLGAPFPYSWSTKVTDNIARAGVNYHFGGGPVVARY
jgi:outer membrane immunogenic protein